MKESYRGVSRLRVSGAVRWRLSVKVGSVLPIRHKRRCPQNLLGIDGGWGYRILARCFLAICFPIRVASRLGFA